MRWKWHGNDKEKWAILTPNNVSLEYINIVLFVCVLARCFSMVFKHQHIYIHWTLLFPHSLFHACNVFQPGVSTRWFNTIISAFIFINSTYSYSCMERVSSWAKCFSTNIFSYMYIFVVYRYDCVITQIRTKERSS